MGLFGTKKEERGVVVAAEAEGLQAPTSQVRVQAPTASASASLAPSQPPRVGIDHAIHLIRSLPTDENLDLVVKVLKTTLESLGVRVADIVMDAVQRQKDLQTRSGQLKSEIEMLEREIEQRSQEIARLDGAYAETTKVRVYLESEDVELTAADPEK